MSINDLVTVVNTVKQTVFDNAIEEGATTEEAMKEVQKTTKEAEEFLEKEEVKQTVKKLKKINKELKKVEEKQKKLEEEAPELKTAAEGLPENNNTIDPEKVSEYKKLQEQKDELTREGLFAEQFVYELTEDYADKHGWREEVKESLQRWFGKVCGFVSNVFGKITGEKAEAMAVVRPFAKVALKAGAKSKAGKEFIKFLVKELLKQGLSQTKINEIMTEFGVDPVSDKANTEGFDEYDDVSTGIFERSSKKPSTSISSRDTMNSSGGSAVPPDPEKEPEKSRVRRTAEDVVNYFKELKRDANWRYFKSDGRGHTAYRNTKTKEIRYQDFTHNEIECFDKKGDHSVRDAITDQIIPGKPAHPLPKWLK